MSGPATLTMLATVVEWGALAKTVAASLAAGIGVTVAFSVAILGLAQFGERRRSGHVIAAAGAAVLTAAALAVCLAAIVFGLIVMI